MVEKLWPRQFRSKWIQVYTWICTVHYGRPMKTKNEIIVCLSTVRNIGSVPLAGILCACRTSAPVKYRSWYVHSITQTHRIEAKYIYSMVVCCAQFVNTISPTSLSKSHLTCQRWYIQVAMWNHTFSNVIVCLHMKHVRARAYLMEYILQLYNKYY